MIDGFLFYCSKTSSKASMFSVEYSTSVEYIRAISASVFTSILPYLL